MASTWSTGGLNLRLMTTGENDNTWGDQTNDNLKRLENKITGYAAVTLSGTTHTLTFTDNPTSYADEDGRNFVLNFGGSPGGTCTVTIPARETVYLVLNNTTDSNTITLTTGSGTTFNVPAGKDAFVYSDGTNVYNAMADAIFTTITGDGSALTGVLHDVVDDTTPQLGGNLDLNSNNITGTGNINITGSGTFSGDLTVDTNTLYVDSANNRVGIGTTSPERALHIKDSNSVNFLLENNSDASVGSNIDLYHNSASPSTADFLSVINTSGNNSVGTKTDFAAIEAWGTDYTDGSEDAALRMRVMKAGSLARLLFYTSGELSINDDSHDIDFRVESNNNTHALFVDGGNDMLTIGGTGENQADCFTFNYGDSGGAYLNFNMDGRASPVTGINGAYIYSGQGSTGDYLAGNLILQSRSNNDRNIQFVTGSTPALRMTIDYQGKVGIGTNSPSADLQVVGTGLFGTNASGSGYANTGVTVDDGTATGRYGFTHFGATNRYVRMGVPNSSFAYFETNTTGGYNFDGKVLFSGSGTFNEGSNDQDFRVESNNNTHALFVDASTDNVLIGTTDNSPAESSANDGIRLGTNGDTQICTNGLTVLALNRNSSDGIHIDIRRQGSRIGYIGTNTSNLGLGTADTGILFDDANDNIVPANPDNSLSSRDDVIDLGSTGARFKHIYYSGTLAASATGGLSFDTNGNAVFNEGSNDSDFRVESDTQTHALFVDAGNNNVLIGTTDNSPAESITSNGVRLGTNGGCQFSANGIEVMRINRNTNDGRIIGLCGQTTVRGEIAVSGTIIQYTSYSDHRLKKDVQQISNATESLKQLNPVNFAWIDGGVRMNGFLAHEVQSVVPEAVTGTHNEVDSDGNPVYQGLDQAKLVPLLTASLKEAINKIEQLEARISALET